MGELLFVIEMILMHLYYKFKIKVSKQSILKE